MVNYLAFLSRVAGRGSTEHVSTLAEDVPDLDPHPDPPLLSPLIHQYLHSALHPRGEDPRVPT